MKSLAGTLAAPFPYFGGKSLACATVWAAFGEVDNYVEPFAGSAAMLLGAPSGKRVETINDADGFVANFWRAVAADADAVAGRHSGLAAVS
jgi:site-specific DNA-adenine methylase